MNDLTLQFSKILESDEEFPVDFDDAWQWIGYSKKENAFRALSDSFEEGQDFSSQLSKSTGGRPSMEIRLTTDCFKAFCMMAKTPKGKEVRSSYLTLEKKYFHELRDNRRELIEVKAVVIALEDSWHDWIDENRGKGVDERSRGYTRLAYLDLGKQLAQLYLRLHLPAVPWMDKVLEQTYGKNKQIGA